MILFGVFSFGFAILKISVIRDLGRRIKERKQGKKVILQINNQLSVGFDAYVIKCVIGRRG